MVGHRYRGRRISTLAARFDVVAARDRHAVAVRAGDVTLTYGALDERSNRLARRLIAAGAGPETLVAVALPRTAELVVALLAVVKSGAGYLPVDPDYPADRIEYVLADARPVCAIGSAGVGRFTGPVIDIDEPVGVDAVSSAPITDAERRAPLRPDNTAYVIYTSGSTGKPKGVQIPHANVARLLDNTRARFDFGSADVWTLFHSYAFDFSVWELWGALLHGGRLVVVDYFTSRSPQQFRELLIAEGVTVLNQTPSAFYQLMSADAAQPPADLPLRCVVFGGEALEPARLREWFARYPDSPRLINMYGITETTVHVSFRELGADTGAAGVIGGALPGLAVRLLDSRLRPVPVGVPGEIYVCGGQLARGYLHRPGLTAGRFVADPYGAAGSLTYRSGDLARWTAAGELEYLGRADQQVNLRGFRVELGEIEAALLDVDGVREAAVVVRADGGEDRLVGYVVGDLDIRRVRRALADRLPEHMVPAAVVAIDRIPLTVNGKRDVRALPAPVFESAVFRRPETAAEQLVADAFISVLSDLEPGRVVGADDDFFALGGSSLAAAKAVARIGAALGVTVPVRTLFEQPRVRDLAAAAMAGADRPALTAGVRPDRLPLSPAQQRMWFLNRFDPASAAYNIPLVLRLSGSADLPALADALRDVLGRHEALRTVYPEIDGAATQVILPADGVRIDADMLPIADAELAQHIRDLTATGFDVTSDVPVRARIFELAADDHVLAVVLHHIAADGSSIVPFVADLMSAYQARVRGNRPGWSPLPVQYADYALWQHRLLGDESDADSLVSRQLAFWRDTLAGLPDQLDLPTDHPRPAKQSLRGRRVEFTLGADVHVRLTALARAHGATLFMVVHAAFAAVLARLCDTSDIAVGTPVAGRNDAAVDEVIGMFVNTVVLRAAVDVDGSFETLLEGVRSADIAALSHTEVPFERLVEVLNPRRSTARHPLVQVGLSFQNHDRASLELPGLTVSRIESDSETAQFDLHLFAVDHYSDTGVPAGIDLALGCAADLFTPATGERIAAQLTRVLTAVATAPTTRIRDLELMSEQEYRFVIEDGNRTRHYVAEATLADLLDIRVVTDPRAIAVIDETDSEAIALDYRDIDDRVNRLARHLIGLGVGPDTTVILALRRSVELVIAMFAVTKAGGAYVPVDLDHPADRIARIVETAAPICVLGGGDLPGLRPEVAVVDPGMDLSRYPAVPIAPEERVRPLLAAHTAYVIFTSGSTGQPKGVAVSHRAIVNQLFWLRTEFGIGPTDRTLLKTPATFDLSVWEFWATAISGGTLVVTEPGAERDPDRLRALVRRHRISLLFTVPSLLGMLLAGEDGLPRELRAVLAIGEALPHPLARQVEKRGGTTLFNLYGPTETAVSVTSYRVDGDPGPVVPIGTPVWNTRTHVLDRRLRPVPPGVPGELYVAGDQLARGYHGQPGVTAARFVADPFGGGRMYRTGDIVRRRADGLLEYLERADFQVKIGGFRIELGEVETALRRQTGVEAAVAVAIDRAAGGSRLIAYAAVPGHGIDGAGLREVLLGELPKYMVPAAVVVLDALPLNVNGKIDRDRLPAPRLPRGEFRAPETPAELLVAAEFAEVVGEPADADVPVGAQTDFFELGGNSLSAARLAARLGTASGVRVPVSAVFDSPTVAALARWLDTAERADRPVLRPRTGTGVVPLSPAQQRMWVLNRLTPDSAAYHVPVALRLSGELDLGALRAALADLAARHEVLRTRYPETEQGPVQELLPVAATTLDIEPITVRYNEIDERIAEIVAAGFDITAAPPIRVRLLRIAPDAHVLVVVAHHISADGYSMAPLTRDLIAAYTSRRSGSAPHWHPLPIQYADYSEWLRALLGDDTDPDSVAAEQLGYWHDRLADAPELVALPTDRPRPARRDMRGATVDFALATEQVERLAAVAREHGTTLFTTVHTAFAVLLAKLSGQSDIVVGAPVAGRGERELDDLVGMFVNTVALRTHIDNRLRFTDLLDRVRAEDLAALGRTEVPFERVVESLGRTRTSAYAPIFQVLFTFQNLPQRAVDLPGLRVETLEPGLPEAKFDLQLTALEEFGDDGARSLRMQFCYPTDIFDERTVRMFARRLELVLAAVAADSSIALRAIDIRTAEERERRSARSGPVPLPNDLVGLIAAAAGSAPESVAVEFGGRGVGFAELHHKLLAVGRAMGASAGPDALINVALAGLLPGILTAGAGGLTTMLESLHARAQGVITTEGTHR